MKKSEDISYKQVQFIRDNDTRTLEERHAALPFVRDEELPEWESWWTRTMSGISHTKNVANN